MSMYDFLFNKGAVDPWNTGPAGVLRQGNVPRDPRFGTPTKIATPNGSTIKLVPQGMRAFSWKKV